MVCWFAALAIWKSTNVTLKSSRLTITTLCVSEKSYIRNVNTFEINQTNVLPVVVLFYEEELNKLTMISC